MSIQQQWRSGASRAPRQRARDAGPLYLAPGADTLVVLDGPALAVTQGERAPRLFPLRRLSRVYSGDRVEWTSSALLACAEVGIAVVFVDEDGEVAARVLGRRGERDELYHRLVAFLLLPEGIGMYRHWCNDLRRRAAWWASARLTLSRSMRHPVACRDWINDAAARLAGPRAGEQSCQWLRGLAFAWMQGHLQDLGLGANTELCQTGEPDLIGDLTEILIWYLEPARIIWLKRRQHAAMRKNEALRAPTHRDLVALFESRATGASVRGREITGLLHRWLIAQG